MLLEIAIFRAIIWLLWPTPFLENTSILHSVEWLTYRGVSLVKPAQEQMEPTVCESPSCVYELVLNAWPKS